MTDKCERCGVLGQDRRTLWMACLYEMRELGVPFKLVAFRGAILETSNEKEKMPWGEVDKFTNTYRSHDEDYDKQLYPFYTLRVCKGCRSEWMKTIQKWFRDPISETVKWNDDGEHSPEEISVLLSKVEALRVETLTVQQQINDTLITLREEYEKRMRKLNE